MIALHAKARLEPLVGGVQSNDRGWKNRYVFVKKSSLEEAGKTLIGGWNTEGLFDFNHIFLCVALLTLFFTTFLL